LHTTGRTGTEGVRMISGLKREILRGDWRKLHNEELHDLHLLPVIIRMSISRSMRCVEHAACMGEKINAYSV
jgi:hypothetical protein